MKSIDNKRIVWLDIIKIVACFSVIVNHLIESFLNTYANSLSLVSHAFYIVQFSFSRIAVPLFLMVTGVLLLKKNYTFKDVLNKIIRIFIPLIVLTIAVKLCFFWIGTYSFKNFFEGPIIDVYWYLYMLISLYLMTPIIQKLTKKLQKKDYIYIFFICFIIPGVIQHINVIFNMKISDLFMNTFFSTLLVYYIIGIYIMKLKKDKKNRNRAWFLFLTSSILYISTFLIFYLKDGEIHFLHGDCSNIFTGLMSISVFYLFRYYFEDKKIKLEKVISNIGLTTFGIYLFHILAQYKISKLFIVVECLNISPIIVALIIELLIFFSCFLVTFLLRKIPVVKKFL